MNIIDAQKENERNALKGALRVQTLNAFGFAIMFGYFAFHFDDDPSSCLAYTEEHDSHEHRIVNESDSNGENVDVGQVFRGAFMVQAICCIINFFA